jgi:hypothetical protein
MSICLYCPEEADSLEHPLPAAFGEFEAAPLLEGRICETCNNKRLGVLDEQLTRCGPEAILRKFFGVQGRTTHNKVNLHYRGSAGGRRLEMKAYDESLGAEVELELKGGREVRQLCQIVFVEASGRTHHLPVPHDLRDPEKLLAEYRKLGVTDPATAKAILICDPEESIWLKPLITAAWPKVTFGEGTPGATNYEQGAVIAIQVTLRYFQAIAKIGFHYFLTQFPEFDGSEPYFSDIRSFIITERGPVSLAKKFIGKCHNPLLGNMSNGARPDGWVGHIVTAERTADACTAHVQLFICEDYPAPAYSIRLAMNGDIAAVRGSGHAYIYFKDGPKGRFSGEARALTTGTIAPQSMPLQPIFEDAS